MSKNIHIGDWVKSYSKGIYRVDRIVDRYYDESTVIPDGCKIGDPYEDRIIVSKRLLNSKFRKSLSYDSCSEYFISSLSESEYAELQKVLTDQPALLNQLEQYKIPPLKHIYNSEPQIDNDSDLNAVLGLIEFIKKGRTFFDIRNEMTRLDILRLTPERFGNFWFQLINFEEEYKDKRHIWRDAKLTKKQ